MHLSEEVRAKYQVLTQGLRDLGKAIVAYSGGVDSSVLAAVAHEELGSRSVAVTAVSPSLARHELDRAVELARERGWNHRTIGTHEVSRPEYQRNDSDRCYWCKTELFDRLAPLAAELDAPVLLGTNLDDTTDHRPGSRAATERGVLTPLLDARLTKSDVRAIARALNLPVADKPASPCLASRIAYGVTVTPARLRRIEAAESHIRTFGFTDLRVRDLGETARIEVPLDEVSRAVALGEELTAPVIALGFEDVTVDLKGFRSGALNENLPTPRLRLPT